MWVQGRGGHKWRESLGKQEFLNMLKDSLSLSDNRETCSKRSVGPCLSLCCQWKCVLLGVSGPPQPLANEGQAWYTKNPAPQPNGSRCICLSKSIHWASAVSQELAQALRGASLIYTPLCIWSAAFLAFLPGPLTGHVHPPVILEARA